MGPCTASSCCCQAPNLPWAPVPPPHAAARSRVSHGSLYGLPLLLSPSPHTLPCATFRSPHTLLVCSIFCHRVLADYGPPIAAARPLICHGPLYRLLMLLPGPPCRPPIAVSMPSAMCTFRSPHTAGVFHFVIGCWQITGLP
ncbi:unnamed protein product [Staurois parvus]|uniref:Uncharacterized protein n=1 Tax=Staurois parvus TaxID=386267 RepID=A0ABN9F709_9NEOB|nr:unnamed protein product [Staurois parvus]